MGEQTSIDEKLRCPVGVTQCEVAAPDWARARDRAAKVLIERLDALLIDYKSQNFKCCTKKTGIAGSLVNDHPYDRDLAVAGQTRVPIHALKITVVSSGKFSAQLHAPPQLLGAFVRRSLEGFAIMTQNTCAFEKTAQNVCDRVCVSRFTGFEHPTGKASAGQLPASNGF